MQADMSAISSEFVRPCHLEYAAGLTGNSHEFAIQFWMELRSSFPSANFTIDHQVGREDALMPPRAAIRWSLRGRHDGWGKFGAPAGADVYLMGASHAEFGSWGLRREYVLYDEVAIWKQGLLQSGSVGHATGFPESGTSDESSIMEKNHDKS